MLETAIALDKADRAPDEALRLTKQALSQAPDLVPAAVLAARLWSRKGDIRKAAKVIETSWPRQPHPDLAEAYLDLRPGDSNSDRLAKAQTLARLAPRDPESQMIVARAALAARDYATARKAMAPLIAEDERPSVRACLIMAELEDAEFGDQGQVREWLARSTRAPRDPVWIADGVTQKTGPRCRRSTAGSTPSSGSARSSGSPPIPRPISMRRNGSGIGLCRRVRRRTSAPVIEASAVTLPPPVEPEPVVVDAVPVAEPVVETPPDEPAAAVAVSDEKAPTARKRGGRSVQKVVFPMSAAPDDPGPDETSEAAAIRRLGRG